MEQATAAETIVGEKVVSPPKRKLEESAIPSPAKKAMKGDALDGVEAVPSEDNAVPVVEEEATPEKAESTTVENEAETIGM